MSNVKITISPDERIRWWAAVIALGTAALGLLTAITVFTYEYIRYRQYVAAPVQTQSRAEEQIRKVLAEQAAKGQVPSTIPFVVATAEGPDLKIEAGYEIKLDMSSRQGPDGAGFLGATLADYAIGGYRLEEAPNASAVLGVINKSVDEFILPYVKDLEITTEVIGCADGTPVRPGAVYSGDLGPIDTPYFSYDRNEAGRMMLVPNRTRLSNEAIAFLRGYDFMRHLSSMRSLQASRSNLAIIGAKTTAEVGGRFRMVILKITAKNALETEYNELGPFVKNLLLPKGEA